jgi:hypothetical protein
MQKEIHWSSTPMFILWFRTQIEPNSRLADTPKRFFRYQSRQQSLNRKGNILHKDLQSLKKGNKQETNKKMILFYIHENANSYQMEIFSWWHCFSSEWSVQEFKKEAKDGYWFEKVRVIYRMEFRFSVIKKWSEEWKSFVFGWSVRTLRQFKSFSTFDDVSFPLVPSISLTNPLLSLISYSFSSFSWWKSVDQVRK